MDKSEKLNNIAERVTYTAKRSFLRSNSNVNDNVRRSLQSCSIDNNMTKLEAIFITTKSAHLKKTLCGLMSILENLMIPVNYLIQDFDELETRKFKGLIEFDQALDIYLDHVGLTDLGTVRFDDVKVRFRDNLLHSEYGLRCIIYNKNGKRYIILDSDDIDIISLLNNMNEENQTCDLNYVFLQECMKTMDTEYDRNILKTVLSKVLSTSQLCEVGIKPETVKQKTLKIESIIEEVRNAKTAAMDMINLRLKDRIQKNLKHIEALDLQIQDKTGLLSEKRLKDVLLQKEILEQRTDENKKMLERSDAYSIQKFEQSSKRLAKNLIQENRYKNRKEGAGAPSLLDSEDEEFIAKSIEDKSSAHGRRHDTTLYLHHRVKSRDLLSLANYNLSKRGKRLIKSSQTVLLRARPRKVNTIEGRRHTGKWLFCAKKPPKTEEEQTETTHHQRSHIKLNRLDMFGSQSSLSSDSLEISMDDKAYIRPGTDVGFRDTKQEKILQVTDESKVRRLPIHDFANPKVFITPSSFRFMTWKSETINGQQNLIKNMDQSVVMIRPKYFIGSNGSVWASDLMKIRAEVPDLFDLKQQEFGGNIYSSNFRSLCSKIHDNVFYFKDRTTEDDIASVSAPTTICHFAKYEVSRLQDLSNALHLAMEQWLLHVQTQMHTPGLETQLFEDINTTLALMYGIIENTKSVLSSVDDFSQEAFKDSMERLLVHCDIVLDLLVNFKLPEVKPVIAEYTDAGPGVGVSNLEVRFRMAEMSRIHATSRRTRIHRARGDSAQNESERTNSAIGEALVDGETLKWDYHDPFEGLDEDEKKQLSAQEVENRKSTAMEMNAWTTAEQVRLRIDDERGPAGDFLKAYMTEPIEHQFFKDRACLMKFVESPKSKKSEIPGHGYFKQIYQFIEDHFEIGELYLEFRKCNSCEYCKGNNSSLYVTPDPVPRPYPDYERLPNFHYLPIEKTPTRIDGKYREPDDFQPRAQLKKMFLSDDISENDIDAISAFSQKYICPEKYVSDYIKHMSELKLMKGKRQMAAKNKKIVDSNKTVHDFNWKDLLKKNELTKLQPAVLDKYITHHKLESKKLKKDKISVISAHIYTQETIRIAPIKQTSKVKTADHVDDVGEFESDETDDEDDIVLAKYDSSDEFTVSSSDSDHEEIENNTVTLTTRGRQIKAPRRMQDYYTL